MSTGHLLLSAGHGPDECTWALAQLVRRFERTAARRGLVTERTEAVPGDRPGTLRSAVLRVDGSAVASFLDGWSGTLCWQAPSPYRPGHRRKNWYVLARRWDPAGAARTVLHEADVDVVDCRTGGPGGQHRDKASTAVRATHLPTGITVVVDTERLRGRNRALALERLRRRIDANALAAEVAQADERRRINDELERGNPVRIERPV